MYHQEPLIAAPNPEVKGKVDYVHDTCTPKYKKLCAHPTCHQSCAYACAHLIFNNYKVELHALTWLQILLSRLVRKIKIMLTLMSSIIAFVKYSRYTIPIGNVSLIELNQPFML